MEMNKEPKIRHLEMIEKVIERMASNCFKLKEWTVGLVSTILTLSKTNLFNKPYVAFIAFIPIIVFWLLDAFYLLLERKYRILYDEVRKIDVSQIDFNMEVSSINIMTENICYVCYIKCLFSRAEIIFYLPLIVFTLIFTFV